VSQSSIAEIECRKHSEPVPPVAKGSGAGSAVRGGGGWVGNSASLTNLSTGASMSAWLGAGVEWAFAPQWSASLEYNYL
jgi:hypothetical protein